MTPLKVLFVSIVLFALLGMLLHAEYEKKELERQLMYMCDGYVGSLLIPDACK